MLQILNDMLDWCSCRVDCTTKDIQQLNLKPTSDGCQFATLPVKLGCVAELKWSGLVAFLKKILFNFQD